MIARAQNGVPASARIGAARAGRAGAVMIVVLFVVAILSLVTVSLLLLTRGELAAADAGQRGLQARAAAMSGIYRAMALLAEQGRDREVWYDNPAVFQAQPLTAAGKGGWCFTVFAGNPEDPHNLRYGLSDEAGKINLNTATEPMLLALPGMTVELVDALLDYRDGDSETRPSGAEQDYYDALPQPYRIKNGPLATAEELLLVKGFTGSVVFGEDANRNGLLETNENDGEESFPPDDRDGQLYRGLVHLATAISYEPNLASDGSARININTAQPGRLATDLEAAGFEQQTIDFIVAARRANVQWPDPSALLEAVLDVPDPRARGRNVQIASGVGPGNLERVMDKLTTGGVVHPATRQEVLFGRVNLNTAPVEVLRALPGLEEGAAEQIVAIRGGLSPWQRATTAWIYTQNVVSADVFKMVSPFVTARSYQYRVRSFGYSTEAGRLCVLEAVIDLAGTSGSAASGFAAAGRITYLRDLTHLGVPFVPSGIER